MVRSGQWRAAAIALIARCTCGHLAPVIAPAQLGEFLSRAASRAALLGQLDGLIVTGLGAHVGGQEVRVLRREVMWGIVVDVPIAQWRICPRSAGFAMADPVLVSPP